MADKSIHGLHTRYSKPWELQANGDIWRKFEKIIDERGQGTTKVTKLKGHAEQHHVDDTLITAENKAGNETADRLAGEAHDGFLKHFRQLANLYVHRTNHYRELVQVVQLTIIRVIEAMQLREGSFAMLQPPEFAPHVRGVKRRPMVLRCISYPDQAHAQHDKFAKIREVDCANLARNLPHTESLTKIKTFTAKFRTFRPNNNEHDIFWLELAMLFEFRFGTLIRNDLGSRQDPMEHFPKPILFKMICQNFSTACKRFSRRHARRQAAKAMVARLRSHGATA